MTNGWYDEGKGNLFISGYGSKVVAAVEGIIQYTRDPLTPGIILAGELPLPLFLVNPGAVG